MKSVRNEQIDVIFVHRQGKCYIRINTSFVLMGVVRRSLFRVLNDIPTH
jgi:hypothetical protein